MIMRDAGAGAVSRVRLTEDGLEVEFASEVADPVFVAEQPLPPEQPRVPASEQRKPVVNPYVQLFGEDGPPSFQRPRE